VTIRWINEQLGTGPAAQVLPQAGVVVLDVRDLVDKGGNDPEQVGQKITTGVELIGKGKRLVVCCDYGMSRSNAIAAGILAKLCDISVDQAARDVIAITGEAEIKIELLHIVREVLEGSMPQTTSVGTERSILLTGSSGFLGKAVAAAFLRTSVRLVTPSSQELDLINGRAELDMLVRSENISEVVHLANPRVYTSNLALGETLVMLRNMMEVCARNGVWMLYPSGWEVYSGHSASNQRADEELPLEPSGPYGETKFLCESLIGHFRRREGFECALIRSSPVYGTGGNRPAFIYNFIEKARRNEPIVTHRYANAEPALDLLHVSDMAQAITKTVAKRFIGDLNLGTGTLSTTRQIAEWIVQWLNSGSTIESIPISRNIANIAMNSSKAEREIGWHAEIRVEEGLRALVEEN
jgi:nucleoside-diphosphate-sugar epimerase